MLGQRLQVTQHQQPAGSDGVNFSLDQVAKKIAAGGVHPKVRAWTLEQLERGRRELGLGMQTERDRATTLLRAVQKKLWVPDPQGAEFIAGAHLMACDRSTKEELCFLSGDCDDLTVLLGSCFLSAGLDAAVVGHAYNAAKNISHVLTAVRVNGRWEYADPSTSFELGRCVTFTRERILSVPNVKVVCDSDSCLSDRSSYDPDENDFVTEGVYVGVDGVPTFAWLSPPRALSQADANRSSAEQVMDACLDATLSADLKTAAAREKAFGNGARCAADAYCAIYRIPPGLCSSIAGPVADAIADLWSSIFGGNPTIDCSKVSTFDPCHDCKLLTTCATRYRQQVPPNQFNPFYFTDQGGVVGQCITAERKACHARERKRIAAATVDTAERAAANARKKKTRNVLGTTVVLAGAGAAAAWYFGLI